MKLKQIIFVLTNLFKKSINSNRKNTIQTEGGGMKFILITRDTGPSEALELVARELNKNHHHAISFLGKGKPFTDIDKKNFEKAIRDAHRVLIGISSSEERSAEELAAADIAKKYNKPFGFFCNTFGEFRRPWFRERMKEASFLFVLSEQEAERSREFAPQAKITPSGNPAWAGYFTPRLKRKEARRIIGVNDDDEFVVLVAGTKELERNKEIFETAIKAAERCELREKIRVFLSLHPGDLNGVHAYDHYKSSVSKLLENLSLNDAIIGSDMVVSSISAASVTAACQRIPSIEVISDSDRRWWKNLSGTEIWEPADIWKTSTVVKDPEGLVGIIENYPRERNQMLQIQENKLCPEMFRDALTQIVNTLTASA